ncbi:MAG: DUF2971 domain-containing protein [Syntrophobacteraceae bacterium]
MKIYKFKDLTDAKRHPHFYQIILQNAVWCAKPESLNDEDEFTFRLDYDPSPRTPDLLTEVVKRYRTTNLLPPNLSVSLVLQNKRLEAIAAPIIKDVIDKSRNTIGIASFSATKTDDRLWAEYGGQGNGACVEIEIPDRLLNVSFHQVHYVTEKIFHVDSFLESALFPDKAFETYRNILLTKMKKWSQEEEIRFVSKRPEVNVIVDGRITEVTLGARVPAHTKEHVEATIVEHCRANGIRIAKL